MKLFDREVFVQAKKPVYVLSDYYENISSDEEDCERREYEEDDNDQRVQGEEDGEQRVYDDISSEKEVFEPLTDLINSDDFEDISVHSTDLDFVDDVLGDHEYACDERTVITEEAGEIKYTREVILSFSDSDEHDDECTDKPESDSDENNNCTVFKTTIFLIMNRTLRREPSGAEEITRFLKLSTRMMLIQKTLTLWRLRQTFYTYFLIIRPIHRKKI